MCFSSKAPAIPEPKSPPPPPTERAANIEAYSARAADRRSLSGQEATILTSGLGVTEQAAVAKPTLGT
jgi:hypothetical protein